MPEPENRNSSQRQRPSQNGDPQFNWRALILLALSGALLAGFLVYRAPGSNVREIPYSVFKSAAEKHWVDATRPLELVSEPGNLNDYLRGWSRLSESGSVEHFSTQVNLQFNTDLREFLEANGLEANPKTETNVMASTLLGFLPIGMFLLVLYFLFRQHR